MTSPLSVPILVSFMAVVDVVVVAMVRAKWLQLSKTSNRRAVIRVKAAMQQVQTE